MRSVLPFLLIIAFAIKSSAQKKDTVFILSEGNRDTIIQSNSIRNNYIVGTSWLTNSPKMVTLRGLGLSPKNVKSTCINDNYEKIKFLRPPLLNISDSIFKVTFDIVANCCHSFICDVEQTNDSTLNFLYYNYGAHCACRCLHKLEYNLGYDFMFEENRKTKFKGIRYITLNGTRRSIIK